MMFSETRLLTALVFAASVSLRATHEGLPGEGGEIMSIEENKALIRRLYEEVWNQHNPEAADEFVAQDVFTRDMLAEYQHGVDGYKHLVGWLHTAFPNLHMDIENMIAEGDEVASFVTLSGTHTGPLRDLAPTRKQVSVKHSHWYRLANGKVVETWSVRDDLGMMQQMKSAVSV